MWLLIIFLVVIGGIWLAFGRKAAGKTILVTILVVVVGFIGLIIWVMNAYPSNTSATTATNNTSYPSYTPPVQATNDEAQPTSETNTQLTPDQICKRDVGASSQYLGYTNSNGTLACSSLVMSPANAIQVNTFDNGGAGGGTELGYSLLLPSNFSSACHWSWEGGSAGIPYSQITYAGAGAVHEIPYSGEGGGLYNFAVSCVDSFGNAYYGVFPSQ
jgi:hypothetical protein